MATYYMSTTGTDGAGVAGGILTPWRTIEYAVTRLSSGDVVYIRGGTYTEVWDIVGKNGGVGYFTFQAYPTETPIFNGPGGSANSIDNSDYIKIIGLEITDYQFGCIVDNGSTNILFQDCNIHDVTWSTLQIHNNCSYVTVRDCLLHDTDHEGVYVGTSGETGNTHHVTITGCSIYNTNDEALEFKEGTHDCALENCNIYNCVNPGSSYSSGGGAVEINETDGAWGSSPNHIVRNNVIHDLPTNAYIAAAIRCASGCYVYNNVIYNIGGTKPGILINGGDTSYARYIYHNTVDLATSRAIVRTAGTWFSRNNIGPTTDLVTNKNLAASDAYFTNKAGGIYTLVGGSAPINAGLDLRSTVPTDKDGATRDATPDIGAYEYGGSAPPVGTPVLSVR
jgi:hypothetical protein